MPADRGPGDDPPTGWRHGPPGPLAPIDPDAPVGGHRLPAPRSSGAASSPEHDWNAARAVLFPTLRPAGTAGVSLVTLNRYHLAAEGRRDHASPLLDEGPAGILVAYALGMSGYDVLVSPDHLLAWGIDAEMLRGAALENLAAWSRTAPWMDEVDGGHRIRSSDTGDGFDAARILLPEVREELVRTLALARGSRVLVAIPEQHLLVAASVAPGDDEFGEQFAAFAAAAAAEAESPIASRPLELHPDGIRFAGA